ncbi:MAG: Rieske 2Fe-2S domain-containing protein [Capsulimonas sp.]|uniref:Rieske 2Fe-2S domain-containing protein n=1 Tax=Capsulimonas sp. TaxID=2494211 RepID=UPI00326604C7
MDSLAITKAIEDQEWLGPVADGLQKGVGAAYEAGGDAGRKVEDALHGVWLGHPLHAVLTDIPLGAWSVAAALDVMEAAGNDKVAAGADAAVGIGLLGALGSAVTGLTDWYRLDGKATKRVGGAHALINITATALYGVSYGLRKTGHRGAGRVFGFLGMGVVSAGAFLGGMLVYDQKIGVDHSDREKLEEDAGDFVDVLAWDDLPDGKPTRVEVNGHAVVLVRDSDNVHALADSCAHLGGPLSEGKLCDGGIVCPWHESRFALTDGRVLDGPSTFKQPHYETKVENRRILVKYGDTVVEG